MELPYWIGQSSFLLQIFFSDVVINCKQCCSQLHMTLNLVLHNI